MSINIQVMSQYHDENKLHFNEITMMSALYNTNTLSCICIVLVQ
jgi:hypothetical protein